MAYIIRVVSPTNDELSVEKAVKQKSEIKKTDKTFFMVISSLSLNPLQGEDFLYGKD
jgi:hypothetical protein